MDIGIVANTQIDAMNILMDNSEVVTIQEETIMMQVITPTMGVAAIKLTFIKLAIVIVHLVLGQDVVTVKVVILPIISGSEHLLVVIHIAQITGVGMDKVEENMQTTIILALTVIHIVVGVKMEDLQMIV